MPLLLSVTHTHPDWAPRRFPFTVPSIDSLASLNLDAPVVCFVGENGSGKSTLLEAIAIAANLPSAGSHDLARRDPTLEQQELLARALTLSWRLRTNRGLFLRAEDFFGFQLLLKRERAEFSDTLERMNEEYADRSDYARTLATGPVRRAWPRWTGATVSIPTRGRMVRRSSAFSSSGWYQRGSTCSTSPKLRSRRIDSWRCWR